jgi:hypothetical protein
VVVQVLTYRSRSPTFSPRCSALDANGTFAIDRAGGCALWLAVARRVRLPASASRPRHTRHALAAVPATTRITKLVSPRTVSRARSNGNQVLSSRAASGHCSVAGRVRILSSTGLRNAPCCQCVTRVAYDVTQACLLLSLFSRRAAVGHGAVRAHGGTLREAAHLRARVLGT